MANRNGSTPSFLRMSELLTLFLRLTPATLRRHLICAAYIPGSCTFGHNPQLMTRGEGWTVDRPVNWELRLVAQLFLHHRFRCSACMTADPAPACPLITPFSRHLWTRPRDTWTPWLVAFRATNPRFPSGGFMQCLNRLTSLNWIIDWDTACSSR